MSHHDDHELEPIPGLPHALPPGEYILWQGRPSWKGLTRTLFHVPALALYFSVFLVARGIVAFTVTHHAGLAVLASLKVLPLALLCLGLLTGLAVLHARGTVYTLTTKRVVMRFGIALPMSFNLPFRRIAGASLKPGRDGQGDIALALSGPDRLAWAHLWPHARPWRFRRAEPMMRAVPDAAEVAQRLAAAVREWSAAESTGPTISVSAAPAVRALPADTRAPAPASRTGAPAAAV